jgi:nucleoside-diphosphate-sugar epimerase
MVRDRLIQTGYALVPWTERPDFCLFGGALLEGADVATELVSLSQQAQGIYGADIPVILLSEDPGQPLHPLFTSASRKLYQSMAEHLFGRNTRTLTLRVFDVYGPDIKWGVVNKFLNLARRSEPLPVYDSGYQTRTFLYQTDFLECIDYCVHKFVTEQTGGILDVGHPDEHSIKRLADSIWQLTHGKDVVTVTEKVRRDNPTEPRLPPKPFNGWKPKTSLRQGLWLMIG